MSRTLKIVRDLPGSVDLAHAMEQRYRGLGQDAALGADNLHEGLKLHRTL